MQALPSNRSRVCILDLLLEVAGFYRICSCHVPQYRIIPSVSQVPTIQNMRLSSDAIVIPGYLHIEYGVFTIRRCVAVKRWLLRKEFQTGWIDFKAEYLYFASGHDNLLSTTTRTGNRPSQLEISKMLFFSFFKTLVDHEVTVELKNDIQIRGTLKSVDQYLVSPELDIKSTSC
jgi:hypothetical protein